MKKLLSILLAVITMFCLSGCSGRYSLHKSGTYITNGEKYTYEIHSFKEKRTSGLTTINFGEFQGYYVYPLRINRRYSSVSYNITHGEGELDVSVKETNESLDLPNGTINLSSKNERYIYIIFTSEYCKDIEIEFIFAK